MIALSALLPAIAFAQAPEAPPPEAPELTSRWGVAGLLAGSLSGTLQSGSDRGVHPGLSAGGGARFGLFAPEVDRVYVGPALALLIDAQINNAASVGLEARFEFLVASPGGRLEPWFNVWLSGGVRAAFAAGGVRPAEWVGVGVGGNVFSNGVGWLFSSNVGGGGSLAGAVATVVGMALIGLLHFEARLESVGGSELLYHFILGVGF